MTNAKIMCMGKWNLENSEFWDGRQRSRKAYEFTLSFKKTLVELHFAPSCP